MEEKVYHPDTIDDQPILEDNSDSFGTSQTSAEETYSPVKVNSQPVKKRNVASELIGTALNTKSRKILSEFQFTETGALQIGKHVVTESGDIRISPNGIVARNLNGEVTFTLDGDTGDAVFKGTITAGSIVSGTLFLGDENGNVYIDGENQQIIVNDGQNDRIIIGYGLDLF